MRSKLRIITKHGQLLGLLAITASLTVSCANRGSKTASAGNNPYSSNPYYTGDSSSSASSAGSAQYPTYDDSSYTAPAASQPETYPSYTGSGGSDPYPSYTGGSSTPAPSSNSYPSYPVDNSYTGGSSIGGSTHTVAGGENLYRISLKYGTTVSAIQNANGLGNTTIYPGQVLQIP